MAGYRAIGIELGVSARQVAHLDRQRLIPTFRRDGVVCATARGLADFKALS
jgi:hypothetical protein